MRGPSIEQARAALSMGIDRLKPFDRFNVIRFASDCTTLFSSPQPVIVNSRATLESALSRIRTANTDVALVEKRLKAAQVDYEVRSAVNVQTKPSLLPVLHNLRPIQDFEGLVRALPRQAPKTSALKMPRSVLQSK